MRAHVASALYLGHLLAIGGIALSNGLLALTLLSSPFTLRRRRSEGPAEGTAPEGASWHRFAASPAVVLLLSPLILYGVWLLAAVAFSEDPGRSTSALSELFSLTTLGLGALVLRGEGAARRAVNWVTAAATVFAAAGLLQVLTGYGAIDQRIRGPFSHWMTFAGVLLVAALLLVARLGFGPGPARLDRTLGRGRGGRPGAGGGLAWLPSRLRPLGQRLAGALAGTRVGTALRWAALGIIFWALVLSLTRSAWLGLAAGLAVFVLVRSRRLALLALPAALVFVLLAPVPVLQRVGSIVDLEDRSNYDRLCMVEAGLHMVAERPLVGMGPEMVEVRYPIYRHPTAPRFWVPHLHNSFLELAAERGLPALGAYLWLMGAAILWSWRRYRAEGGIHGPRADLWMGVVIALVGFQVAGLFENNWGDTEVQRWVLFVLAIPLALAWERRPEEGAELEGRPAARADPGPGRGR